MECGVVPHLLWKRTKEVPSAQLLDNVNVKVPDHDDPAVRANALLAAAEFSGLHVALEDVDAFLGVERHAGYLIETDDVVLRDEPSPTCRVVDEHVGNCRFSARDEMGVWRHLLE